MRDENGPQAMSEGEAFRHACSVGCAALDSAWAVAMKAGPRAFFDQYTDDDPYVLAAVCVYFAVRGGAVVTRGVR